MTAVRGRLVWIGVLAALAAGCSLLNGGPISGEVGIREVVTASPPTSGEVRVREVATTSAPTSGDVDVREVVTTSAPKSGDVGVWEVVTASPPTSGDAGVQGEGSFVLCGEEECTYSGVLRLARPIAPPGRDTIDTAYRFGTRQGGKRDPHHGVEFLNSHGTPVLAAAEGVVVVAGDDRRKIYGPYSYFYGNLVVLKHTFPDLEQPLFTLYGHLSEIMVKVGDVVQVGQQVGKVGMTGVATGSHLHFEVRLGENTYQSSRNPELWLAPHAGEDERLNGALAGRIIDQQGNPLKVADIVVEHLTAPDQPGDWKIYLETYSEKKLVGLSPWEENFAAGDLPPGLYRISFVQYGLQYRVVEVLPGELTVVTFHLSG